MMMFWILGVYCVLILVASLAGGWIPLWIRLTHERMQLAISLVAGFMLGVALLHLLPHALMAAPAGRVVAWMTVGLLVMFFIERFFCFHHHDVPHEHPVGLGGGVAPAADDPRNTAHGTSDPRSGTHQHDHSLTWSSTAMGLTLHSVIAGIALGASTRAESTVGEHGMLPGFAVFLVIVLHKPFDALTLGTLMAAGGWSMAARHLVNGLFALAVPLGAVLVSAGLAGAETGTSVAAGVAVAFAAGVFLCVSLSDLLPELQFHQHDRIKLSAALLLGIALAWTVSCFEAGSHDHVTPGLHKHVEE